MSAIAGGVGSVPAGERLLWRGGPDPDRVARAWLRSTARVLGMQLVGLFLVLGAVGVIADAGTALPWIIGFVALVWLVPVPLQYRRVRRDARERSYLLTDERVVIESRAGRRDLRIANLPDLCMELQGGGYGSILFTPPAGGGPERYLQRLARWLPQLNDPADLLVCIPEAERVLQLLRRAQAEALAGAAASTPAAPGSAGPPAEAPVARQPFMRAAAVVPFWFGGLFLLVGLGALVAVGAAGLSGAGGWWQPAIVGAPFALLGVLFLRARYLLVRERGRLRAVGVRARGRVLDVAGTGTQVNEVEQWIVRYVFEVRGVEHAGQSAMVPWVTAARYAPGDAVAVTYDPDNPAVSTLLDLGAD